MLSLPVVQICAAIGIAATVAGFALQRAQLPHSTERTQIRATRTPVKGTQPAWIAGTLIALLWGVGVFIAPGYAYHWPSFPDFAGSWAVQIAGIALSIAGGLLFARSARTLGREMTPSIRVRQGHQLVQTGPYRLVRHPVYTAIMMVAAGQALFFLSAPVAVLSLLLFGLAFYRAHLEEALLRSPEGFGATYEAYMARTGRFLPPLHGSRPPTR